MSCKINYRPRLFVIGCLLAAIAPGCGSNNPLGRQAISGTVQFKGVPLEHGSIDFAPLAPGGVASGALIAKGKYAIAADQGLPAGKYQVAIIDSQEAPPLPPGHMPGDKLPPTPKPQIPAEWNTKSQHTVEVKPRGANKFDFDISATKK